MHLSYKEVDQEEKNLDFLHHLNYKNYENIAFLHHFQQHYNHYKTNKNHQKVKKFMSQVERGLADGTLPAHDIACARVFIESDNRLEK